ncbi:MAG TPA: succinylglutamate desuccinylase/aspartoacylase family protein, partial [Verrucomicrobiales bacterium]|nr:succinylglutamate desuccinylase/aspartoacylase family protein [Verrucomicrobiales bacterium]
MPEKPLFQHHVIHGRRGEGPTLLVIAGVHGDEFEGPAACRRLIAETDPDALSGNLHVIPMANESACRCRARCGSDGLDLARTFPGRADGSITERVAHALSGIIRAQLARPDQQVVGFDTYNQLFTMHGTVMVYLFAVPFAFAVGNYLVPLMV